MSKSICKIDQMSQMTILLMPIEIIFNSILNCSEIWVNNELSQKKEIQLFCFNYLFVIIA
jgi:hypothetical protein